MIRKYTNSEKEGLCSRVNTNWKLTFNILLKGEFRRHEKHMMTNGIDIFINYNVIVISWAIIQLVLVKHAQYT